MAKKCKVASKDEMSKLSVYHIVLDHVEEKQDTEFYQDDVKCRLCPGKNSHWTNIYVHFTCVINSHLSVLTPLFKINCI